MNIDGICDPRFSGVRDLVLANVARYWGFSEPEMPRKLVVATSGKRDLTPTANSLSFRSLALLLVRKKFSIAAGSSLASQVASSIVVIHS